MKKIISLLLAVVMVLSLCACGSSEEKKDDKNDYAGLQVGFGRASIHPEDPVPLGGYGDTDGRISKGYLDLLMATCIAFKEGGETVLLFTQDLIRSDNALTPIFQEEISKETGIPADHILFSSTHTHSAPDLSSNNPAIGTYKQLYQSRVLEAAKAALADLAPATLYGTDTATENMNFQRHYVMKDGTYAGSNFGDWSSGIAGHAAENDPQMRLVQIKREGGKQDILLMNWQAHPCNTGGYRETNISADYIAPTRDTIEKETGMLFAFFLGAAGDQNTHSQMSSEKKYSMENKEYGKKLAQCAIDALPNMQKLEGQGIKTTNIQFEYAVNHEDEEKAMIARDVVSLWQSTGDKDQGNALARKNGLSSVYHANAVLSRGSRPKTNKMNLTATRIGSFGFVNAPYEMFAASGKYIKENSPYDMTFVISCSNGSNGYYPTQEAFAYGCYESHTSYYGRGVAEATAEKFVEMLKSIQ